MNKKIALLFILCIAIFLTACGVSEEAYTISEGTIGIITEKNYISAHTTQNLWGENSPVPEAYVICVDFYDGKTKTSKKIKVPLEQYQSFNKDDVIIFQNGEIAVKNELKSELDLSVTLYEESQKEEVKQFSKIVFWSVMIGLLIFFIPIFSRMFRVIWKEK